MSMKTKHSDIVYAIHQKFYHLTKLSVSLENTPIYYGTEELLTGPEIHLIEAIGNNEQDLSVTDLAGLCISPKGQFLKRSRGWKEREYPLNNPIPRTFPVQWSG